MSQALKLSLIWVGCVVAVEAFFFGMAFGLGGAGNRVRLSRSWRVTTGTIIAADPRNHNAITVRYRVAGRAVEQTFTRSLKGVGEAVDVYYSPDEPTLADIENPSFGVKNDLWLLLLAGLALGTFAALLVGFRALGHALGLWWTKLRVTPRGAMTSIATAVLLAIVFNLFFTAGSHGHWLPDILVLCGTLLLLVHAFRLEGAEWRVFIRSPIFILGGLLVMIGQVIRWH